MNKYLIFRTDRIGDFLISSILIKSIKSNDPKSHITIVASEKNHFYVNEFPFVDNVIKLKNNFFGKISVILKLIRFKFNYIILHDEKKRSKFISTFLRYNNKILFKNSNNFSHIEIIKFFLKKMNFIFYENSLNIFEHKKNLKSSFGNYVQLHFDEKWIFNNYIKKFINIEPSSYELFEFIKKIINKTKMNLVITTGVKTPQLLKDLSSKLDINKVKIIEDSDFLKLENIALQANILISCHGAISHVASAINLKQIDIIDKSYNYKRWTNHFRNYNFVYRDKFSILSKNILMKL